MNEKLLGYLPKPRITEARYWNQYTTQEWFKALRVQRRLSVIALKQDLADAASASHLEKPEKVIAYYKKRWNLERESRWVPRNRRDYPNL